jgi:hypothetical protein
MSRVQAEFGEYQQHPQDIARISADDEFGAGLILRIFS